MSSPEQASVPTPEQAMDRINAAFGRHPGYRALHARGKYYQATFTAEPVAATLTRAAHMSGEPIPTLVRLSNGAGDPDLPDKAPDVRGLAVSFRPPGGATDLLAQTAPRFPVRTVQDFLQLTQAAAGTRRKPWLLPLYMARHPGTVPALVANLRAKAIVPPPSFAVLPYYPVHAYGWHASDGSSRWVRYTWLPAASSDSPEGPSTNARREPNYLHEEFEQRLARGPVRFTLEVRIAADGDDPNDPTSVWRTDTVQRVGTLEITEPTADPEADGSVVVFDPTRVIDGIELSQDPILRYRAAAYSESVRRRTGGS
jgi:catalase